MMTVLISRQSVYKVWYEKWVAMQSYNTEPAYINAILH